MSSYSSLRGESFYMGECDGHLWWPTVVMSLSLSLFVRVGLSVWNVKTVVVFKCQKCLVCQRSMSTFMSKVWVGDLWHVCLFNCHCHLWCRTPFWDVQWDCLCFVMRLFSFYVKKLSCDFVNYVGSWKWTFMFFEVWPWQIWRLVQVFGQILCCEKHFMCCFWGCIVTWYSPAPHADLCG